MTRTLPFSGTDSPGTQGIGKTVVLNPANARLFDEMTKLACDTLNVPYGFISIHDGPLHFIKSGIGLNQATLALIDSTPLFHDVAMDGIIEIPDALEHDLLKFHPLTVGESAIRFYAGIEIHLPDRSKIGTLSLMDRAPHQLDVMQRRFLRNIAKSIAESIWQDNESSHAASSESSRLAAIVESSDDAIISKALDGTVLSWNRGAEILFGYDASEMIGKPITCLFPEERVDEESFFLEKIRNNQYVSHFETERKRKDGQIVSIAVSLSPIKDKHGEVIGIAKIARDITQQKKIQSDLERAHEKLKVTMDSIGDAVITTDKNGLIEHLNPVAENLTGWKSEEARGVALENVLHLIDTSTRLPARSPVQACLATNGIVNLSSQSTLVSRNGIEFEIEDSASPIRDPNGETLGVVLVFHDVTSQHRLVDEMNFRAKHDALTGLVNRSEFERRLERALASSKEQMQKHALMYIDLDQFKLVNDTCGRDAGDNLLKEVVLVIEKCIRSTDTLARIGGDEFAIILEKCDAEPALRIAELICRSIDDYRFKFNGERFRIGASIGLVILDDHWENLTTLMQAADHACYAAKEAGRNRVHLFIDSDYALEARRGEMKWAGRIEQAIEDDKFVLFCQRIMPLSQKGGEHGEILIRMKDDHGGLIPPGVFLPAAERFHLASRIDRWVVHEVLMWLHSNLPALTHMENISVNLSGQSLGDPSFHVYVQNLIESYSLDCTKLCFEITETAAITNIDEATKFMNRMKNYGVRFSLDDFGSGVSSFVYLKSLPVDYLKIDGQFISDLIDNPIDQATVRCITEVAKVTGKKTIAEWVEHETVETMLKDMGIDYTQGFFRHKPAPLDYLLELQCSYGMPS